MKKIFSKNIINIYLSILCAITLTCCESNENYDFPGDSINRIFLQSPATTVNGAFKYNGLIVKTPVSTISDVSVRFPVHSTMSANKEIKVTMSLDNSLVNAYNSKRGTNFKALPDGVVDIENNILTIPIGAQLSLDSVTIVITNEKAANLKVDRYLIPIKITTLSDDEAQVSEKQSTMYVEIEMKEDIDNIWDNETPKGTLVTDRSSWNVTITPSPVGQSGDPLCIFDGIDNNYRNYWYINYKEKTTMLVDMHSVIKDVSGLYINRIVSNSKIFSSIDGNQWTEIGTTSSANIAFYTSLNARYFKWEIPASTSIYGATFYFFEFNAYIK